MKAPIKLEASFTQVFLSNGNSVVFSYETPVVVVYSDTTTGQRSFQTPTKYSKATSRHIKKHFPSATVASTQEVFELLVKEAENPN